jgi:septum site-determining protein MinD
VIRVTTAPATGVPNRPATSRVLAVRFGTPVAGAVVTRITDETDVNGVADRLGVPIRGAIPDDPAVSAAAEAGEPLVVAAPDAEATHAYRQLAADLVGDESLAPDDESTDDEGGGDNDEDERTGFLRWLLR